MKICLIHMKVRNSIKDNLKAARKHILKAYKQKPVFIGLPEYFSLPSPPEYYKSIEEIYQRTYKESVKFLEEISYEVPASYIVGGTVIEREAENFFNTCTLWRDGENIGKYQKRNLTQSEIKMGLKRGEGSFILDMELGRVGLLICADIFSSKVVDQITSLEPEVIFLPVSASNTHPEVQGHPLSEEIASEKGVFINKIGNVRSNARGGRSAVIAPWGVVAEASDAHTDMIITADLDLPKLREYVSNISKTPSNDL